MKKFLSIFLSTIILGLIIVSTASAHVGVKPAEVKAAAFQIFSIGVPVEKDIPTTGVRLVIPEGLNHVTPNVKPGWTIEVKKMGEGEEARVTEIIWTGGTIPAGQRDDFLFSAQAPSEPATIAWKAYQTYQDGSVVSWDQDAEAEHDEEEDSSIGPYSKTVVIDDLASTSTPQVSASSDLNTTRTLSIVAVALGAVAIGMQLMNKKK